MKTKLMIIGVGFTRTMDFQLVVKGANLAEALKLDAEYRKTHGKERGVFYTNSQGQTCISLSRTQFEGMCRSNGIMVSNPKLLRNATIEIEIREFNVGDEMSAGVKCTIAHMRLDIKKVNFDETLVEAIQDKIFDRQIDFVLANSNKVAARVSTTKPIVDVEEEAIIPEIVEEEKPKGKK